MGLASYFSKDLLAINRLISTDQDRLEKKLLETNVAIVFDQNAIEYNEGRIGLDLIVRLCSRFYPNLTIVDLTNSHKSYVEDLKNLAKSINGNIDMHDKSNYDISFSIGELVGAPPKSLFNCCIGSDRWIGNLSRHSHQKVNDSYNPFGIGVSTCMAVSNAFRHLFRSEIDYNVDGEISFNVYDLQMDSVANPDLPMVKIKDVTLVGIGAIGNGVVWSLSNYKAAEGEINIIDNEVISESNLQRYVLFNEGDLGKLKVSVAGNFLNDVKANALVGTWAEIVSKDEITLEMVAVAIDNAKDRIGIQSSLPRFIYNAFTEPEAIGITRHLNILDGCLACSYIPTAKKADRITEIANNCNIPTKSNWVKDYYNLKIPVNHPYQNNPQSSLLNEIAVANDIDLADLKQYEGQLVDQFYSDFVCGGVILKLGNNQSDLKNVDAPLAFQSALAGILLGAEMIKHLSGTRTEDRLDFYHLSPLEIGINPFKREIYKDTTGKCLCNDQHFVSRYRAKWQS